MDGYSESVMYDVFDLLKEANTRNKKYKKFDTYDFGQRLSKLRAKIGLSQKQLADEMKNSGIGTASREKIKFWECAERKPNVDDIMWLAQRFDVSAEYLLGLTDVKSNDASLKNAVNAIGLTEECVEKLFLMDKYGKETLSFIIADNYFGDLMDDVSLFLDTDLMVNRSEISNIELNELYDFMKYKISTRLVNIISDMSDSEMLSKLSEERNKEEKRKWMTFTLDDDDEHEDVDNDNED